MTLALVRLSGMVRLRAVLLLDRAARCAPRRSLSGAVAFLLAPLVAALPRAQATLSFSALLGELAVGLVYGLTLTLLNEMLLFAGQIAGLQFSFSLVNLLDPTSAIQTPLLGDLFQLMGTLVVLAAGLDRILLASMVRSFRAAPLGSYALAPPTALAIVRAAGGIFLAAVELAAPVLAATMLVEIAVSLLGKLSPQLPVMSLTVPLKTLTGFAILTRLAGPLAALHRGALRRPARPGRAADRGRTPRSRRAGRLAMPGERTEQATQHRREKARREGDILHSRELSAAAGTLAGVMAAGYAWAARILEAWRTAFAAFLALGAPARWEPATLAPTLVALRRLAMLDSRPRGDGDGGRGRRVALRRQSCQTGGISFHPGALGFKPDRINPGLEYQKPLLAARRRPAGQIAHSRRRCWPSSPCSASPAS